MFRPKLGRPSGLSGSHQPFAQAVDELAVGLRQVRKEAVDGFDDHAPLGETRDGAERIEPRLELEWHSDAQLRVILYLLSFFRTSRGTASATTITSALFGHGRKLWC